MEDATGKVLVDRDFPTNGPAEDFNWRIPIDPPRDIRVIVWYAAADGLSKQAKDAPDMIELNGKVHPEHPWPSDEE